MAQLRLALAQINPTVGDLDGNADQVLRWARQAADAGRPCRRVPRDGADRLPGRGPGAAPVVRRRVPRRRSQDLAERLAADGLGELLVVVGYLDGAAGRGARAGHPARARRRTPPRSLHGGAGGRPLRQAPPAELRRLRRVPLLRAGHARSPSPGCTASTSPSPSARTSGRRAARSRSPGRPAPGCCWSSTARRTSATRTTPGSTWCAAGRPAPAARSPT